MASVEKYRDTSGKELFAARWREHGMQRKERGFTSKRAAQKYGEGQEADARRGHSVRKTEWTVADYARHWATTRGHRDRTALLVESKIKNHVEATRLGNRKLADVRQSEVQAWATDRARALAPSTMKNTLSLLGSVFTSAVHDELIVKTPVVNIRLPKAPNREKVPYLTVAQVVALADAMPPRWRAAVITHAGLGLRAGELVALRVEDVDWVADTVRIDWQLNDRRERVDVKSPSSHRTLPLPPHVKEELVAHLARYGTGPGGEIFTNRSGRPTTPNYYGSHLMKAAVLAAGGEIPADTTSHDLRHHYASALLKYLSTVEVAALLGHEDATLVEKTYGHTPVDASDRAREAMAKEWAVAA